MQGSDHGHANRSGSTSMHTKMNTQKSKKNELRNVERKQGNQWKPVLYIMEWGEPIQHVHCNVGKNAARGKCIVALFFTIQRSPLILSFFFPFSRALSRSMCATHWKFQNAISPRFLSNWWMCVQFNSFQCTFSSFSVSSVTIRTFAFLTTSPLTYTKFDMKRKRTNFSMLKNATDQKKNRNIERCISDVRCIKLL